jgi:hypothetical protein
MKPWVPGVTCSAAAAAIFAAVVLMAVSSEGYEAWNVKTTTYEVMGGDHAIRVTAEAENTGTSATGAACYSEAYSPDWKDHYIFGTAGVISYAVPVHGRAVVKGVIRVTRELAAEVTAVWILCS